MRGRETSFAGPVNVILMSHLSDKSHRFMHLESDHSQCVELSQSKTVKRYNIITTCMRFYSHTLGMVIRFQNRLSMCRFLSQSRGLEHLSGSILNVCKLVVQLWEWHRLYYTISMTCKFRNRRMHWSFARALCSLSLAGESWIELLEHHTTEEVAHVYWIQRWQ